MKNKPISPFIDFKMLYVVKSLQTFTPEQTAQLSQHCVDVSLKMLKIDELKTDNIKEQKY